MMSMRMVSVELGGVAAVFKSLQNYAIFEEIVTFAYVKPFPMTDKERIDWLRNELTRHNYNYYVKNAPEITDQEFDGLMHELLALEAAHPEWDDDTSPSRRVGSDLNHEFTQVAHRYPMLSLDNTYNRDEVGAFYQRVSAGLGGEPFSLCCELKFDGLSISLTYEEGRLVRAVTRGDGVRGDDVTENVRTIRTVPLILPPGGAWPASFEMRGEVLMPWESFERLNREREAREEPLFANPRNAAAGTLKLQNSSEVARRKLDAYLYYLLGDNLPFDNHYDNLIAMRQWGFKVSNAIKLLNSIQEVEQFISYWDTERKHLPVATDGLVFKVNSLRQQLNLGYTAKNPRWAIAYKFQAERECTKLQSVSFEVGRSGVITPVANLEPVLLSGTIVKRASLHNEDIIRNLDIHDGDMLYVEKGGEIIPKIVGVNLNARINGSKPVSFITHCPACGSLLQRIEGEASWVCPNKYHCPPQITGRIEHFVGRHAMNIDGIGEEVAEQLYNSGLVKDIADLYDLSADKLMLLDRFGLKSAQRIIKGIDESRKVPFERVIYALSIPYVGETVAKKLAFASTNIDNLMSMSLEQLSAIDEIGIKIAQSVIDFFNVQENRTIVERLRNAGLQMQTAADDTKVSDKLAGKTIVISGVFNLHSRDEYKKMIEVNGGKNSGSISAKTSYLLAGENMGPAKLEKAQKLGITIIDEKQFLALLNQEPKNKPQQS